MQETRFVDKDFSPQKLVEVLEDIYWKARLTEHDENSMPGNFQVEVTFPSGAYTDVKIGDDEMLFRYWLGFNKAIDPETLIDILGDFRWSACVSFMCHEENAAAMITYRLPIPIGTPFAAIVDALNWFGTEVASFYHRTEEIRE